MNPGPSQAQLGDGEFSQFRNLIYRVAGISMSPAKKALVAGRLARRLSHHGLSSYGDYYRLLAERRDEMQVAIDLLTTNETYFFREEKHFDFLRETVLPEYRAGKALRVWSAASSTGEEAYSLAMLFADVLGEAAPWEIFGSDLSTRVLACARAGIYDMARSKGIPAAYLRTWCLKGVGSQAGRLLVDSALRRKVRFAQVNLNETLPDVGMFDVVFLRNVMIYFEAETKQRVVERIAGRLRPGGLLFVGHSESLSGIAHGLSALAPSIYRKG